MQALYIHVVMHLLFFVTNFKFLRITILKTIVHNGLAMF